MPKTATFKPAILLPLPHSLGPTQKVRNVSLH